jgi:hypothetical protein
MAHDKNESYFHGGGIIEKTLRFLNLLEPGHMVLSLSKLAMWASGGVLSFVVLADPSPTTVADLAGAATMAGGAVANYGYRRYSMYANGQNPYPRATPFIPPSDPPGSMEA